jgi:flagellar assembly protein FliH
MAEELTIRLSGRLQTARAARGGPGTDRCVEMMDSAQKLLEQAEARAASVRQTLQALQTASREFRTMQGEFFGEAEEQLVDLALDIARKVLAQEIKAGRYEIDPIVREALGNVEGCREVVVHLNPEDYEHCNASSTGAENEGSSEGLRFVADPGVPRAGCLLETPHGTIESLVEGQLAEVQKALKGPE